MVHPAITLTIDGILLCVHFRGKLHKINSEKVKCQ